MQYFQGLTYAPHRQEIWASLEDPHVKTPKSSTRPLSLDLLCWNGKGEYLELLLVLFSFSIGSWIQGPVCDRQVSYHWALFRVLALFLMTETPGLLLMHLKFTSKQSNIMASPCLCAVWLEQVTKALYASFLIIEWWMVVSLVQLHGLVVWIKSVGWYMQKLRKVTGKHWINDSCWYNSSYYH